MTSPVPDDLYEPLPTKEGWRRFADDLPQPPPILTPEQLGDLDPLQRQAHQQARLDYHARLGVVTTPVIREVLQSGRRLMLLNRHQISARRGLIVTGPTGTGKTTAITQLGKIHEHAVRRQQPDGQPRMPVVYVTVPPAATPKMLAIEFAQFLGMSFHVRTTQTEVTNAVCDVLCQLRTGLVLVDELHNLSLRTRAGAEASDQLKYLSERIPATFVYAGIDLEGAGLFSGIRGRQIAGRFTVIPSPPFAHGTTQQRHEWQALVATLEQALRLRHHPPGRLLKLAVYLHERSAGMIGSLSQLIRSAAVSAIQDGSKQITKAMLEGIRLDHAAEDTHRTTPRRRRPSKPPSNERTA